MEAFLILAAAGAALYAAHRKAQSDAASPAPEAGDVGDVSAPQGFEAGGTQVQTLDGGETATARDTGTAVPAARMQPRPYAAPAGPQTLASGVAMNAKTVAGKALATKRASQRAAAAAAAAKNRPRTRLHLSPAQAAPLNAAVKAAYATYQGQLAGMRDYAGGDAAAKIQAINATWTAARKTWETATGRTWSGAQTLLTF